MHLLEWKCLNCDWNVTKFCSLGSNDNLSALVQIVAWHRTGNKPLLYLNQWWSKSLMHICVTRPQGVKLRPDSTFGIQSFLNIERSEVIFWFMYYMIENRNSSQDICYSVQAYGGQNFKRPIFCIITGTCDNDFPRCLLTSQVVRFFLFLSWIRVYCWLPACDIHDIRRDPLRSWYMNIMVQ